MRYSMLVYITKMCRTLLEAAQYLRAAPEGGVRTELLENGQQMLVQIRDVLEQHRDDLRSKYPLAWLSEAEALWGTDSEAMEEPLELLVRELPDQVHYQVRAVFFTELGEKWDAMESVYEYMQDDPRFDPVVVRTPVGRVVEQDGKRKQEIIYKDFLTPMGIPSLGYDEYDIEEDCPELAFISQPYESCALEQFWPENIAKQTRLVYLPYYIPGAIDATSIDSQCRLPVYRYAWKTIGMSERHQRFYRQYAANRGANMLMTGLPKVDAYVKLRTAQCSIPENWKINLTGRKSILWNTRYDYQISSIPYFERLLRWFEANNDYVLIWRPHPMTDTVTKLYYPSETYDQLQKYVAITKGHPNMILDQETSCNAAFAASTAMISDYSSLIPQYLLMDKPVLWTTTREQQHTVSRQEHFIDWGWMEAAVNAEDITMFLNRIKQGNDLKIASRKSILRNELPYADGKCGERVCQALWRELHNEDKLHIPDNYEANFNSG